MIAPPLLYPYAWLSLIPAPHPYKHLHHCPVLAVKRLALSVLSKISTIAFPHKATGVNVCVLVFVPVCVAVVVIVAVAVFVCVEVLVSVSVCVFVCVSVSVCVFVND
jgi:hypothetical protein